MPPFIPKRCISQRHPRSLYVEGPTLPVTLALPAQAALLIPNPPQVATTGLIDTGATVSAISAGLARQLRLDAINTVFIQGAHSLEECNVYVIDLTFTGSGFWIRKMHVCEMADAKVGTIGMLVGRDVLQNALFTYDGYTGQFIIDVPSLSHPDHPANPKNQKMAAQLPGLDKAIERVMPKQIDRKRKKLEKASRKKNRK